MKDHYRYDPVIKDLFQKDRPTLLSKLAGNARVVEFLNTELAVVEQRSVDLLVLLSNDKVLHIDFQSNNHPDMAYREGIYGLMIGQKLRKQISQVVIYVGEQKMRVQNHLNLGDIQVRYRLIDIRSIDSASLLATGNPGDYALALLAKGGTNKLREIIEKANKLPAPARERVLTRLVVFSGLRGLSEQITMEFKNMGIEIEVDKNAFLREIRDSTRAQALAEGEAIGEAKGKAALLRDLLQTKFGKLPKWADTRLKKATAAQAETWAKKVLSATSLEAVIGKR